MNSYVFDVLTRPGAPQPIWWSGPINLSPEEVRRIWTKRRVMIDGWPR